MNSPWLVAIVGPPAVGKMTVGQQLAALTGFRLYYNHQVIDLLTPYFPFGTPPFERLATDYRRRFFEEAAAANLGIVATWGWRFDVPEDQRSVEHLVGPFLECGGRVSYLELAAPLEVRLHRNGTENRRANKNTDWSTDAFLAEHEATYAVNSTEEHAFPWPEHHLRIDNTQLDPATAAKRAHDHFGLPSPVDR